MSTGDSRLRKRAISAAVASMEALMKRDFDRGVSPSKDTLYAIQLALAATAPRGRKRRPDGRQK